MSDQTPGQEVEPREFGQGAVPLDQGHIEGTGGLPARFENPGLAPHVARLADVSEVGAKRAEKHGKDAAKRLTVREAPASKGIGAGGVIAIILGVGAALGVLYAAWQTLRADDELWVADDPLRAPDA